MEETPAHGRLLLCRKPSFSSSLSRCSRNAQTIETQKSDRNRVVRLQTVANHLSVIELAEPVTEVAAGSSSYKIEWRGNKVFIQPLEPDATTNLFIWTASGRLNYELVAVQSVTDAQFAIDQEPPPAVASAPRPPQSNADRGVNEQDKLASELLFASHPVRLSGEFKRGRVQVLLKDVYRRNNRVYLRYAIQNDGRAVYRPGTPGVFTLQSPRSPQSLYVLSGSQLAGDAAHLTAKGQTPLKVADNEVHASAVPPGGTAFGLVAFDVPATGAGPTVFRLAFPPDSSGQVSALLVL